MIEEDIDALEQAWDIQRKRRQYQPWEIRKYKPMSRETSSLHKSLSEEFLEKLEEEGDEEDVFQRFLRKGLRQPGTRKEKVEAYLNAALRKAEEEGRI